jgi:hypothetical protein
MTGTIEKNYNGGMDVYRYNPYGMKVKVKTIEKKTGYGW